MLFIASSSLSWLHQMSPTAPARSHAAIQVNLINSSFRGAQFYCYRTSHCHPSRRCSLLPAAPHRWASALPWNKLSLSSWTCAPCTVHPRACERLAAAAGDEFLINSAALHQTVTERRIGVVWHSTLLGWRSVLLCKSLAFPLKITKNIDAFHMLLYSSCWQHSWKYQELFFLSVGNCLMLCYLFIHDCKFLTTFFTFFLTWFWSKMYFYYFHVLLEK